MTLEITQGTLHPLSIKNINLYRSHLKFVKVVIINECSMIGAKMLSSIDSRLKKITANYQVFFWRIKYHFYRRFATTTTIYKQKKQSIAGPMLWRVLKFSELDQVMWQQDRVFSLILTKIGDELPLNSDKQTLIKSRMFSEKEVKVLCPREIRLFHDVRNVENYINDVLNSYDDKIVSIANDEIIGCQNATNTNRYHAVFLNNPVHITFFLTLHIHNNFF